MKLASIFIIFLIFTGLEISAERIPGTKDVINDFVKTEEFNKNKKISKDYRKKNLEKNLTNAIKYTMHKKFPDYKERIKDLKADTISFEQEKGTFNYYVNFKDYYLFYNFAVDPEIYVQLPQDEKMFIKMIEQDAETKGTSSGASSSAPSNSGSGNSTPTSDSSKAKPN